MARLARLSEAIRAVRLLLLAVVAILAVGVAFRVLLPRLVPLFVFHPEPLRPQESDPRYWGFPQADEVRLETADGVTLHAWWFPSHPGRDRCGAALFLHGNAGHLGGRGEIASGLASLGFDVLLPDYRGYGLSEGRPTEEGLYADAVAARAFALERSGAPPSRLLVVGNSLGAAVAADLATRLEVGALVLVGSFTSTPAVARRTFRWVPEWLLEWERPRFDTVERVRRVRAPVMVAAASADRVIPPAEGRAVFEAAPEPKVWYEVMGAGHNDVFGHQGLWLAIARFALPALGCAAGDGPERGAGGRDPTAAVAPP